MPASNPLRLKGSDAYILPANEAALSQAAALLTAGQIVAVPTETVYGLAANAADAGAVQRIYTAKGRPDFNPLIVHVPNLAAAEKLAHFCSKSYALAQHFWPGALTLVLPRKPDAALADAVTAGLSTVALRCPAHPLMLKLLEMSGLNLAAPSANKSGAISPSEAAHVAHSLGDNVPLILNGGACSKGLESTIVTVTEDGWRLLRLGPISRAEIAAIIGEDMPSELTETIEAPGQLASHYAPTKPLRLNAMAPEVDEYFIALGNRQCDDNLSVSGDLIEAAARLYASLHRADASNKARIAIAPIKGDAIADAINDRLARAAHW